MWVRIVNSRITRENERELYARRQESIERIITNQSVAQKLIHILVTGTQGKQKEDRENYSRQ